MIIEKETLEEAAKKYCLINNIPIDQMIVKTDRSCEFETPITMFIEGAKWQQKQLTLSDEEIDKIAKEHILYNDSKRQWFIEGMKIYRDKIKVNNNGR